MNCKKDYKYKNLKRAQAVKKQRLFNKILLMLEQNADLIFLTLTFKDSFLESTNERTRERYIREFLNSQAKAYILNRDYGKKNDREHYHALIKPKANIIIYSDYKYGTIHGESVNKLRKTKYKNLSIDEIAKALTIHATKNSTKDSKIIYSRTLKANKELTEKQQEIISNIKLNNELKRAHFKASKYKSANY